MGYVVSAKPTAARINNAIRRRIKYHPAPAEHVFERVFWNGIRASPALRFRNNVCDHIMRETVFGPHCPDHQRCHQHKHYAGRESPSRLHRHSSTPPGNGRWLLECATNIRLERDHFELKLRAGVADFQVFRKLA